MREKNFQTIWHKYLVDHPPTSPEVHELKLCKRGTFAFDAVKDHQIEGLKRAKTGLFHKIADSPVSWGSNTKMRFTAKKPFDCLWLIGLGAYVVICFYEPRKYKKVFKIEIDHYLKLRNTWVRKSIRLDQLEAKMEAIFL